MKTLNKKSQRVAILLAILAAALYAIKINNTFKLQRYAFIRQKATKIDENH